MESSRLLVVDDEPLNVELLTEALEEVGYLVDSAGDGLAAWEKLQENLGQYDAVLLDRMMPRMSGMELLQKMKQVPALAIVPVILQTARASKEDIVQGLKGGAHYYLAKPYDDDTLLAVVATAVTDHRRYRSIREQAATTVRTLRLLECGTFKLQTLHEARDLCALLANVRNAPDGLAVGLMELLVNAIEHGNLGIDYQLKSELLATMDWPTEIERRLALPENSCKYVSLEFSTTATALEFRISDHGEGFDWQDYQTMSADRAFDHHGRGIAIARALSFSQIEYQGKGNVVVASVNLRSAGTS